MKTLEELSLELTQWQDRKGLPNECAFDQLHSIDLDLIESEREYLSDFINRWDKAQGV